VAGTNTLTGREAERREFPLPTASFWHRTEAASRQWDTVQLVELGHGLHFFTLEEASFAEYNWGCGEVRNENQFFEEWSFGDAS